MSKLRPQEIRRQEPLPRDQQLAVLEKAGEMADEDAKEDDKIYERDEVPEPRGTMEQYLERAMDELGHNGKRLGLENILDTLTDFVRDPETLGYAGEAVVAFYGIIAMIKSGLDAPRAEDA